MIEQDEEADLDLTRILSESEQSFNEAVCLVGSCHIPSIATVEAIRSEERRFAKWQRDIAQIIARSDPEIVTRKNVPERILEASNISHDRRDESMRRWQPAVEMAH